MANSILLRNMPELYKSVQKNIDYIDLSYKGVNPAKPNDIVLHGGNPIINEYKMWLQSKPYDYIRRPDIGGFLWKEIFNFPFLPESEEEIEKYIIQETELNFPNIVIVSLKVTCNLSEKCWNIKVSVYDKITGLSGIDVSKENDIVFNVLQNQ